MTQTASSGAIGRIRRRRQVSALVAGIILIVVAALCYLLMLGMGAVSMTPGEVLNVLTGGGNSTQVTVVWDLRLPVAIATVIIGAALGIAGSWTQTMARNPLASPDVLGLSGGASVMVVLGTVTFRPEWSQDIPTFWWRAGLAVVGAVLVVILLVLLGGSRGGVGNRNKIILVGFALSLMMQAIVSFLMLKAELLRAAEAQVWLAGSTGFVRSDALLPLILGLLPFLVLGLLARRDLPVLAHSDESARALGVATDKQRGILLIASTGVIAVSVSLVGPITFVALIAPHIARLMARAPIPPPLVSACAGAALLTLCSVIATALPVSAPVGSITAIIGGISLVILVRMNMHGDYQAATGRN